FGRLFAILDPPFPKHSGGPVQMGRLSTKMIVKSPKNETLKERPCLVKDQVSCQDGLHCRYQLESHPVRRVKLF
ncbi:MAG: hypothetical protein MJH10_14925, partial [Epibacterium sp.]|nr:hypothetical protein [Epibacterium sp.]